MVDNNNDDDSTDFADKTSIMQSDTFKLRLAEAGKAPPSLVLLVGPASSVGRQWPLEDTDRIIGRSPNAHIYVDDKSVSKSHAKVMLHGGDVTIMDLESTNKTVINGKLIAPLAPLHLSNNDQIKCGNVIFKFLEQGNLETVASAQTYGRSQTDALTGIANRGALNIKGPEAFKRSGLLGIPLSLIAFDIDHFKKVNDTYGHPAGDFVLKDIARVIGTRLIRGNDFSHAREGRSSPFFFSGAICERLKKWPRGFDRLLNLTNLFSRERTFPSRFRQGWPSRATTIPTGRPFTSGLTRLSTTQRTPVGIGSLSPSRVFATGF